MDPELTYCKTPAQLTMYYVHVVYVHVYVYVYMYMLYGAQCTSFQPFLSKGPALKTYHNNSVMEKNVVLVHSAKEKLNKRCLIYISENQSM